MRHRTFAAASTLAACVLSLVTAQASAQAEESDRSAAANGTTAATRVTDDFNGDGHRDLAIGTPNATVNGRTDAGSVVITYGTPTGIDPTRRAVLTQDSSLVPGAAEQGDRFGAAITSADLDNDGYGDLVIGSPGEDLAEPNDQGSVSILWGGPKGPATATTIHESYGTFESSLGRALAVGHFDLDDKLDLAIVSATSLWVTEGGVTRTSTPPLRYVDNPMSEPVFRGRDTNGAASGRTAGGETDQLAVFGSRGTKPYTALFAVDDSGKLELQSEKTLGNDDDTGYSAGAIGDVDADGYDDVVAGIPTANGGAGRIQILWGAPDGPGSAGTATYDQASLALGTSEAGDAFGHSVSVRDVTGDGLADIAVGSPGEDVGTYADAGSVALIKGAAQGTVPQGRTFHQGTAGVPGAVETGDRFGHAVRLYDATRDGHADLALTAPDENAKNGTVWLLPGTTDGLTTTGSRSYDAADLGVTSTGTRFGSVLNR
ncbi:hypothetical protein AQ490_24880 [Wenjunlia vitaminophila]|uniref:Integrin-like protein n=1 Tax=Wenjunlia vitaminophila TaxID=76728 RepID=A0A0T6LQW9_WENVI|nr:FG-GAP-like repeat-containing protein [Wenjunlia vitaminophila]KRV48510.1 hypothetical protein AQ490_24880 [Wenjunlia vitaminophila]